MLGADIGTYSVELISLLRGVVQHVAQTVYPGWPSQPEDEAQVLIANLVHQLGARRQSVWSSIGGTAIVPRLSTFPAMSDEDLRGAVTLEAEQFVSRDWSRMDFDYDILETLPDGEVRVLFVAAPRELSDRQVGYFRASGLYCAGMTVDSLSVATAFLHSATDAQKGAVALLVNIGAKTTSMTLLNAGNVTVLRDIAFGGNGINEVVMAEFGITFAEAEEMKSSPGEPSDRLKDCVARGVEPLLEQISRTIGYETRRGEGAEDVVIYLCGGGSFAPGMADRIAENFGFPVEFFDPFANVPVKCELPGDLQLRSRYVVALGNALMGERAR